MKIGDAVRIKTKIFNWVTVGSQLDADTVGVIVGFDGAEPVVFWNTDFPEEVEYKELVKYDAESTEATEKVFKASPLPIFVG